MKKSNDVTRRRLIQQTGLLAVAAGLWPETLFPKPTLADEKKPTAASDEVGRKEILKGLDGMSRAADPGSSSFVNGHMAAAVISAAYFCREEKLDAETCKQVLSLVETRMLKKPIFEPRKEERADPDLIAGIVQDLDAGIATLRRYGHNIIFAAVSLKALRTAPDAATPTRIKGLREMVKSFGTSKVPGRKLRKKEGFVDLSDEQKFIHFVLEEYLSAMDLYLVGKGNHGFAGHLLTTGHALVELHRMKYKETAAMGVAAYWQFVEEARRGTDLGGKKVKEAPPSPPSPLKREFWVEQSKRDPGELISSHLIKYPHSFFALARDLHDDKLKERLIAKLYHLTPIS